MCRVGRKTPVTPLNGYCIIPSQSQALTPRVLGGSSTHGENFAGAEHPSKYAHVLRFSFASAL